MKDEELGIHYTRIWCLLMTKRIGDLFQQGRARGAAKIRQLGMSRLRSVH
jgi:hypothetical protein